MNKIIINKGYRKIANSGCCGSGGCCSPVKATTIGYSEEEAEFSKLADLGLGCGNPTAQADIKDTDIVLDLGSGAGMDCFLASRQAQFVYGVDMTIEMVEKARLVASKLQINNVQFKLGEIEDLPFADKSIDVVLSNCVINLSMDKPKVFSEIYRVLKDDGRAYISDIVLTEELSYEAREDMQLLIGCVAGALLKDKYLQLITDAGLQYEILNEDTELSKSQYEGQPILSLKLKLTK